MDKITQLISLMPIIKGLFNCDIGISITNRKTFVYYCPGKKLDFVEIANDIRRRIRAEMGVTASVGVSWNKIFAKLGIDKKLALLKMCRKVDDRETTRVNLPRVAAIPKNLPGRILSRRF